MADLHSGRSWTDTVTNSIFFKGLDAAGYLKWTLDRKSLDHFLGPEFLHEYTHHWCFRTLVGTTLALIDLRLQVFTETFPDGRPVWARDWIASYCLTALLRPLAEGLALFCEFDATLAGSRDDVRMGTPIGAASLCFAKEYGQILTEWMLQNVRHSDTFLDRKASLYLKKFEIHDGYLPGYMTIKNLYFSMLQRKPDLSAEMFMSYVRSFFWDDAGFTNILISTEMDGNLVVQALDQRFRQRLTDLFMDVNISDKIDAFWRAWSSPGRKVFSEEINIQRREAELGITTLSQLAGHSLELLARAEQIGQTLGLSSADLIELFRFIDSVRGYVVVARNPATVEKDRVVFHNDADIKLVAQAHEFANPLPALGEYDCYAVTSTYTNFFALLFRSGSDVTLSGIVKHPKTGVDYGALQHFVSKWPIFVAQTEQLRNQFESSGYGILHARVIEEMIEEINHRCLDIYTIASSARVADISRREARRNALRNSGLKDIFGRNALGIRAVAAMSLIPMHLITDFGSSTKGLVTMIKMHHFLDIAEAEIIGALQQIATADNDSIILKQAGDETFVFV